MASNKQMLYNKGLKKKKMYLKTVTGSPILKISGVIW